MSDKLEEKLTRFKEIESQLSDPKIISDPQKLSKLSQERARSLPLIEVIEKSKSVENQIKEISDQLKFEKDEELIEVLDEELASLEKEKEKLTIKIEELMLPRDPDAGKNVFLEIRAGTGGDEAALFSKDLFRMYSRYFDEKGVKYEIISMQETGLQGFKEIILLVKGEEAHELMHLEAGGHRVQRIPETESGGRVHTSACTVAVIPEVSESELNINQNDLRIDVFRSSGPGGQSVNTTDSAVRITHIPTGIVVSCQDEKSQHKNKAKALKILRARIAEQEKISQMSKLHAEKKAQIGTGDRSEKIRTYNFPQNRMTDHRIGYTSHNLDRVMEGDIEDLIEALHEWEKKQKLENA
ncbi:MAG: peptide chain release factor 1 [Spirochaetia bacterium]|nr:peptide chain release factor 1 [Spirochaetia bacterium]